MQRIAKRFPIALLTFIVGVILAVKTDLPIAWMSFLLVLFSTPLTILVVVIHRAVKLKGSLRPTLGKGILALVLWLTIPSFVMLNINAFYLLTGAHLQPVSLETVTQKLTIFILNITYALAGLALCYWVNRVDNQGA